MFGVEHFIGDATRLKNLSMESGRCSLIIPTLALIILHALLEASVETDMLKKMLGIPSTTQSYG
jgi:hypothetical protein